MKYIWEVVQEEIGTDGDYKPNQIPEAYNEATEDQKKVIDSIFISLCGWSLKTIIERSDER